MSLFKIKAYHTQAKWGFIHFPQLHINWIPLLKNLTFAHKHYFILLGVGKTALPM